jgi:RNA polymerase sigma-70 factor (ECF subfamily)
VSLILKKNEKAFVEIYYRYSKKMFSYFYRMLGGTKDRAQDFVQDLFFKLIEKPGSFDRTKKFSTWFYTLAFNMCKNEYKKIKVRDEYYGIPARTDILLNDNLNEIIDLKSFTRDLYNHLEDLDDNHRSAFILRYGNYLSVKEIAEIEGCPEGTVKSRIYYTIKYLSEKLIAYKPGVE